LLALTRHRLLRYTIRPHATRPEEASEAKLYLAPFWFLSALHYGFDIGSKVVIETDTNAMRQNSNQTLDESYPTVTRRDTGPQKLFRGRVVERWIADPAARAFGIESLRLRAAIHPLEPFTAEHERLGVVLPTYLDVDDARARTYALALTIGVASDGLTKLDCQRSDLIAETLSLLYYPFWIDTSSPGTPPRVWDAVNGNPEHTATPQPIAKLAPLTPVFDELSLVEARCQRCKEPLPLTGHGIVYPCHACDTFWVAEKTGLEPFSASYAKPQVAPTADAPLLWLPFWRVEAIVSYAGQRASEVLHAHTLLNISRPPGGLPGAPANDPLSYFVPAYGSMRAPRLDFAARDLNRLQPLLERGHYESGKFFSCFLGPEDALKLAYVVWLQIIPGALPKRLASLRVETGAVELWYVPFADQKRELTNLLTGMRYDRRVFRGVGH
ncbi:MAG: hypothetical protein KAI47_23075, partial [Deltaproteobacteria bacterium]|nr:hypothetical protein [Deltaproteobacteria bacterium]